MKFFGARKQSEQYIPKRGIVRPGWTYRGARRNAARIMHWPERYRYRVWWRAVLNQIKAKMRGTPEAALAQAGPVPT